MKFSKKLLCFGASLVAVLGLCVKGNGTKVSAMRNQSSHTPKVIMVGSSRAGKTCAFNRIIGKKVGEEAVTISVEFQSLKKEGNTLFLVSPSGLERFRSIATSWLSRGDVAILMFDISNDTYRPFDRKINEANEWCSCIGGLNRPIKTFYWFNQIDKENYVSNFDSIKDQLIYGDDIKIGENSFFVSAMTGEGIDEAMNAVWKYVNDELIIEDNKNEEAVIDSIEDNKFSEKTCLLI